MDNKPMTKSALSSEIAERTGLTKKAANDLLDDLADIAYKETRRKGQFTLPGVGKLVLSDRKARTGRNPATGEVIQIPAKKVVKFRVAKACKDGVLG